MTGLLKFQNLSCVMRIDQYVTPLEFSQQRGQPRFKISKEQLKHLRSLSFT